MSSVRDVLHGRAGQLAATTPQPSPDAVVTIARSAGRVRRKRVVVASAASALGIMAIAAVGYAVVPRDEALPPVAPTPSQSPSESPSPTPTATPTEPAIEPAIVEGFAPVPQLPASEIPWGEVGPGWFVVDYAAGDSLNVDDTGWIPYPEMQGGVSLVSPDGAWYAAADHADLGTGPVGGWDGQNLWMLREATTNVESIQSRSELVALSGLGSAGVPSEASGRIQPFEPGKSLYYAWGGEGLVNSVSAVDKTDSMGGCSDADSGFWGWEATDMSFLYSPANAGKLVCFGYGSASGSDVTLVNVSDVASSEKINHFSHGVDAYAFVGWIDSNEFFFARKGGGGAPKMFRYDLRDDSITEVDLPMYDDVDGWHVAGYFDRVSQRHIVARMDGDGWSVGLFGIDGATVATVEGACDSYEDEYSRVDARTSGGRLLINCATSGALEMYSLDDGARIGAWDAGTERKTSIFDAPDN